MIRLQFMFMVFCLTLAAAQQRDFYVASVYEHARFDPTGNDSAKLVIDTNLGYYRRAAEIAKSKGADVIVYPEYGIFPPGDRINLKKFLEDAPDPKVERCNPCEQAELYATKPILFTLSCIAKNNSMFVVANTGDIKKCTGNPECPQGGSFHFNTNVVFDRNGTLVVRYHKEHLFYEFGMDLAREQQDSTFQTDFGTFATYICFDIDFGRMSEVAQGPTVDGVMFTTMWINQPPQMTSVQLWESWALANNATILASNVHMPGYNAVGSGIFHAEKGALAYTFDPDGISKLVVATVNRAGTGHYPINASITAITESGSYDWKHDGENVALECSTKLLNESTDIYKDYRCIEENYTDYTFLKLSEPNGYIEACNNGLCCSLHYSTDGLFEHYYLGVFSGIYQHFTRYFWYEEDCILARCDAFGNSSCGTFPMKSNTVFQHVHLSGNFTSRTVYPSVISSDMRLVPAPLWYRGESGANNVIQFENYNRDKLLTVGMKGRRYDRDPPYVR